MNTSKRMQEIITNLAKKHGLDLTTPESMLRLDMKGFYRLVIEMVDENLVKVGHYYEQQESLIADPEIIFFIAYTLWVPIEITQVIGGHRIYAQPVPDDQGIILTDPDRQESLADFAETWAENIELQGWLDNSIKWAPCQNMQIQMPQLDTLIAWVEEGGSEATDGCWVETDGVCPHGCESWLLKLNLI